MGSLFDEEEEEFDMAAVEARHGQMEAQEQLDAQARELEAARAREQAAQQQPAQEQVAQQQPAPEQPGTGTTGSGTYPESDWEAIVEAVLFTMGNSVELRQLAIAIDQSEDIARQVVERLMERYRRENRGMQIIGLESAYQMSTQAKFYENLIRVASAPKKHVLTDVVLETLSIIAYKQPVTKVEISRIRGVSSDHAVNRLVEYGLVYEVGRLDAPGRPALFATTEEFLRRFGVGSTTDLPTMDPEQEEEIIQEVEEELQMKIGEAEEEPVGPEAAEATAAPGITEATAAPGITEAMEGAGITETAAATETKEAAGDAARTEQTEEEYGADNQD